MTKPQIGMVTSFVIILNMLVYILGGDAIEEFRSINYFQRFKEKSSTQRLSLGGELVWLTIVSALCITQSVGII